MAQTFTQGERVEILTPQGGSHIPRRFMLYLRPTGQDSVSHYLYREGEEDRPWSFHQSVLQKIPQPGAGAGAGVTASRGGGGRRRRKSRNNHRAQRKSRKGRSRRHHR